MAPTLRRVLSDAREAWLAAFAAARAELEAEHSPTATEVLFALPANGSPEVFRLWRADLAAGVGPKAAEVNLERIPSFAPFQAREHGLELTIEPLVWNGIEISMEPQTGVTPLLEAWARRWLDLDEVGPRDLLGAIHSITPPEHGDGELSVSVDFGTAPIAALEELLVELARLGVRRVRLGSRWAE